MFILYIEKKLLNPNGTTKVYVVKANEIEKGQIIDETNVKNLFVVQERRNEQIIPGAVKDETDLIGKIVTQPMYKNEITSEKKLDDKDSVLSKIENKREITIKLSDFEDAAGGSLREGDKVDILETYTSSSKVRTEPLLKNLYVYKALSSDGVAIDRRDKTKLATTIKFLVSVKDAALIENSSQAGKFTLIKVVDDTEYDNFFIENQKH
jgi:Flp pilus assembly protein CpaB